MSLYQQVTEKTQFRELLWQRGQVSCEPDNLGPHSAGQNGRSAVSHRQAMGCRGKGLHAVFWRK